MKNYKVYLFLFFCFMAGFLFTALAYLGMWEPLKIGLSSLSWWLYILICIASFYVTLFIHEMTHFLVFYFMHVKLRALYLTIFIFYKSKKGWRFTIDPHLWILFGGLVVPDLDKIDSDEKYDKTIDAFSKSLIGAPIATISFALITFISFFFILAFSTSPLFIAISFVSFVFITLLSLIYIRSFSIATQHIFGDFAAHKKVKEDPWFQLAQLIQYQSFSLENHDFNTYLFNRAVKLLNTLDRFSSQLFKIMLLSYYFEGVNYNNQASDETLHEMISKLNARSFGRAEHGLFCAYELAIYKYHIGHVDKSYQIYQQIQKIKYKDVDEKLLTYQKNRFEHITHLAYHEAFLNDPKHVYNDHMWIFKHIYDASKDHYSEHMQQKIQNYACIVDLNKEKNNV
ncbi:M50 family metallopeptidase [Mycoplasmatota bacterium]|nr:M50 family metallopeptidase [Mycoplasmatota bacterium]